MSTVAERVRLAFNAATGESKPASSDWVASNPTHYLEVRNVLGSRRREAVAQVTAKDSLNVKYLAVRSQDWTSVDVMTHILRDAYCVRTVRPQGLLRGSGVLERRNART